LTKCGFSFLKNYGEKICDIKKGSIFAAAFEKGSSLKKVQAIDNF